MESDVNTWILYHGHDCMLGALCILYEHKCEAFQPNDNAFVVRIFSDFRVL